MPNIKSAKKKLKQDVKRTIKNNSYLKKVERVVKSLKKSKNEKASLLKKAYSVIDKAAKNKIIHKNKAARLKSRVSKLLLKKKNEK